MLSWDWISAWWEVFGVHDPRLSLAIWTYKEGEILEAALPLYRIQEKDRITYRLIGTGEPETDEVCADYLGPLVTPGRESLVDEMAIDLSDWAQQERAEILLTDMTEGDPACERLAAALGSGRMITHRSRGSLCPYLSLPPTYETFFSSLSSNFRAQIRQSERSWRQSQGARVRWVETESDLEPFWNDLVSLHQKRWKILGKPGVFSSERFTAFHHQVIRSFLSRGWLRAAVLEADHKPVSAVYAFAVADTVFFYQSGTDSEVPSKLRPGLLLHMQMIQGAIEQGAREYDFLRGDDPYKKRFTDLSRTLFNIEAGEKTFLRSLRFFAKASRERVRRIRSRRAK